MKSQNSSAKFGKTCFPKEEVRREELARNSADEENPTKRTDSLNVLGRETSSISKIQASKYQVPTKNFLIENLP